MKRKEIALDTNILIDHFNGDPSIDERFLKFDILFIPIPVVAEMEYGYPNLKNPNPQKKKFDAFLERDDVKSIVCDRNVAGHFAVIKRQLREKGAMIPVNDIWIATCCIAQNITLATRDSDFRRVAGLEIELW